MNLSVPALDYIVGSKDFMQYHPYKVPVAHTKEKHGCTLRWVKDTNEKDFRSWYIRPDNIIKSSVGEFYDENMTLFFSTIKELWEPVRDAVGEDDSKSISGLTNQILFSLFPMGFTLKDEPILDMEEEWFDKDYAYNGFSNVLPEIAIEPAE